MAQLLAAALLCSAPQHLLAQRLPDSNGIAAAIGVSGQEVGRVRCTSSPPSTRAPTNRVRMCSPSEQDVARLAREGSSWGFALDSLGRVYAGQRHWRDGLERGVARRDSIAGAMAARGALHLACADSVFRKIPGGPRWTSIWQGKAYNAILSHTVASDSISLTLEVSPGLGGRCFDPE